MKIPVIQGNEKKYHFGEKLQNHELNLVLRKTAIIMISRKTVFVKYCPDFKVFSRNHERNIKIQTTLFGVEL